MEMGLQLYTPNFQVSKSLIHFRLKKGYIMYQHTHCWWWICNVHAKKSYGPE